jgi:hypothetical protein
VSRVLAALVLPLALIASGCGGSSKSSATTTTTTVTETTAPETTTQETTTEASGSTTSAPDLSKVLGDKDCLALASVGATIAQAYAGGAGTSDASSSQLEALAGKVPDEIKADVETLAKWYADYGSKIKAIGLTPGQTPTADQLQQLQSALASFDEKKLTAASNRISAWANKNCTAAGG